MKKLTLLVLASVLTALSSHADLIWYDGFQYTNGSLAATNYILSATTTNSVSQGLWLRVSGSANPDDMYVVNSNLQVTATGAGVVSRQDDCCRYFATTNGTPTTSVLATYGNTNYDLPLVLYASFTVICSTTISNGAGRPQFPGGTYFASFYSQTNYGSVGGLAGTNADGYGYVGRVQAFTNGTQVAGSWRLGVTDNTLSTNPPNGGFPVDLAVNTPYTVVEEFDPITLQAATIWVNPISPNQTGSSPVDPKYTAGDSSGKMLTYGVNAYAFRQATSANPGYAFLITNLAVATTFSDAFTNVASTNAVAPVIVYQPAGITNFVGSSVTVSAVANGQGLGSMTYQWQQNGTNYTGGSGGTANILTISPASTNDSGNFTLIATTPYGLSATSSIAIVSISGGTNSPSFTTQPVSQTIYAGQSATFSTTVVSPGNPSYTWYSNNVVIPGQNASTLTLNNATASFAASYKVAVTNDVNIIGIVSTNAVLTVINPPTVTIAYLRTLVDPNNNYQATNSTLPYQTTGTITTYTNITSGNTASYYLQDATAGINIFATFGSTFRPAQGDVVTFVGVMSSFSSGLELDADPALPYTSYTDTGTTNALPAPLNIPFTITNSGYANMNTNIAGRYVELTNVFFGANAGTTISSGFMTVTNDLGQSFNLWFSAQDLDTVGQTVPVFASSVTGVMFGSMNGGSPNFAVAPTKFSGIVVPVSPIPLSLNVSGGTFTFNWTDSSFTLQDATNVTGPWSDIPGATDGFTTNAVPEDPTLFFRLYHP